MTDMTDNEKRVLREWAEKNKLRDEATHLAARYILATVDAPATTLSEDLAHIIEFWESWATDVITGALTAAATHAEQMERDLAEARAEAKTWREQDENDCEAYMEELKSVREALAVEGRRVEKIAKERDEARVEVSDITEVNHEIRRERDEARNEMRMLTGERNEALIEVERLTIERDKARYERNQARAEVEFLTDERLDRNPETKARVESALNNLDQTEKVTVPMPMPPGDIPGTALPINISAIVPDPTTPNPADVKEEEPYHIYYGVYGNDHTIGVRIDGKWRCIGDDNGVRVTDDNIARLTRLVPAPRVITNADELDTLAEGSIVRDRAGHAWEKYPDEDWYSTESYDDGFSPRRLADYAGPVTVLWEPGA